MGERLLSGLVSYIFPTSFPHLPFLYLEQTSLDIYVHDFNILEGWLVGPGPARWCPSHYALREESVFACDDAHRETAKSEWKHRRDR
jgi:hypothetical protein